MVVLCARWPKSIRPPIGRAWSKQVPPHAAKAQWQPKRAPQTMALSLARPNVLFCSGGQAWPLPNWPRAPLLCCAARSFEPPLLPCRVSDRWNQWWYGKESKGNACSSSFSQIRIGLRCHLLPFLLPLFSQTQTKHGIVHSFTVTAL